MRLSTRLLVLIPAVAIAVASPLLAQKVSVDSADPASTVQDTTLNVTIRGRGFSPGAVSKFLVTGTNDNGRVTVNSTAYINSTTLVANVTAADDAVISFYDIAVTTNGRTGKGIEKFSVKSKQQDQAINPIVLELPEGCDSAARLEQVWHMNDDGIDLPSVRFPATFRGCAGESPANFQPYLWAGTRWEPVDLLPGMTSGFAYGASGNGTVVGSNWCYDSVKGESCAPNSAFVQRPGQPSEFLPLTGFPSDWTGAAEITNDGRFIVGTGSEGALLWSWDGQSSQWVIDVLGSGRAEEINADGTVVLGSGKIGAAQVPRVWYRVQGGEPFETVDLSGGIAWDVSPSGSLIVGTREVVECSNRRCTQKIRRMLPVFWRRISAGEWTQNDLTPLLLSSGSLADNCDARGVSEVIGKGAVAVGQCNMNAVAWLPDANGAFGAPIALPSGSIAYAVNRYGWVLGVGGTLPDGARPVLWKLP